MLINTKSVCLSITGGLTFDLGDAVEPGKPLERSLCHDIASVNKCQQARKNKKQKRKILFLPTSSILSWLPGIKTFVFELLKCESQTEQITDVSLPPQTPYLTNLLEEEVVSLLLRSCLSGTWIEQIGRLSVQTLVHSSTTSGCSLDLEDAVQPLCCVTILNVLKISSLMFKSCPVQAASQHT